MALIGAGCGSSPAKATGGHHKRHHAAATTTTTKPSNTTTPSTTAKLASGPKDKKACAAYVSLGKDAHNSHRVIGKDFRRLFRDLKHAENKYLRKEGHRSAVALLEDHVRPLKKGLFDIFLLCNQMGQS